MKDYKITEVKIGTADGGMACSSMYGPSVAEAKFIAENGESFYLLLADIEGIPNFYKTPESTFEKHINEIEDDAFWDDLNANFLLDTGDYEELFAAKDSEYYELFRYLIYLATIPEDKAAAFVDQTEGKHISEIAIPKSDYES